MAFNFNTGGDTGVMQSAMGAARIKADAQDQSGMNALAGQVTDWANDELKEERRIRLESRAEARGIAEEGRDETRDIAKEGRQAGVLDQAQAREDKLLEEKRAHDKPLMDAKINKAKAETRKADRWQASNDAVKKKYLSEKDAINYKLEAKDAYDAKREDMREKRGIIWDTDTEVFSKDASGEEKELSVNEALSRIDKEEADFMQMIDSKTQLGAGSSSPKPTGKIKFRKKAK